MDLESLWWLAGAAFVAPYAISYLKADGWTAQRTRLFAVVVSVALGVVAYATQFGWAAISFDNVEMMLAEGTGVWFLGQVVYDKLVGGTALEVTAAATKVGILPVAA
jgi:hypothetical protein